MTRQKNVVQRRRAKYERWCSRHGYFGGPMAMYGSANPTFKSWELHYWAIWDANEQRRFRAKVNSELHNIARYFNDIGVAANTSAESFARLMRQLPAHMSVAEVDMFRARGPAFPHGVVLDEALGSSRTTTTDAQEG